MSEVKFTPWMMGLASTVAAGAMVTVGSLLWQGNAQMARMQTTLEAFGGRIMSLENAVLEGTRVRYTSSDAAIDKNAILAMCAQDRQSFLTALQAARSDCLELLNKHTSRLDHLEERTRQLEIWAARAGKN